MVGGYTNWWDKRYFRVKTDSVPSFTSFISGEWPLANTIQDTTYNTTVNAKSGSKLRSPPQHGKSKGLEFYIKNIEHNKMQKINTFKLYIHHSSVTYKIQKHIYKSSLLQQSEFISVLGLSTIMPSQQILFLGSNVPVSQQQVFSPALGQIFPEQQTSVF